MKYLAFLLLIVCCRTASLAQFAIKDIVDSTGFDMGDFVFPVLQLQGHAAAAKKINRMLQVAEIGQEIVPGSKDPIANLKHEDVYGYTLSANGARIFSLEVMTGHNGAGHHFRNTDYSFDAQTGDLINENNLFSLTGKASIRKLLYKLRKKVLQENVNHKQFGEVFKECLAEAAETTEVGISRMVLEEKAVVFRGQGCLDGSIPEEYDPSFGPYRIGYEELLHFLSPYGLSLFIGAPVTPTSLPLSLLKGKIDGKYDITLVFTNRDASSNVNGIIVYDRVGIPIPLSGTVTDNTVVFHEMDASNTPVSDIECSWNGKVLTGTFKNQKSGKQMSFAASR